LPTSLPIASPTSSFLLPFFEKLGLFFGKHYPKDICEKICLRASSKIKPAVTLWKTTYLSYRHSPSAALLLSELIKSRFKKRRILMLR
jgi:hypothetical protein